MKKIVWAIILLLIFPYIVNATSVSISISCSAKVLRPGESTNCVLKGTSDEGVGGVNFKLVTDSNLTISNFKKNTALWTMGDLVNNQAALLTTSPVDGTFNIGTFTITASSSVSSNVSSVLQVTSITMSIPSQNFAVVNGSNKSITITISKTTSNTSNGGNGNGPGTGTNTNTNTNTNTGTGTGNNTNTNTNTNQNTNVKPNTNTNTNTNVNTNTNTNTNTPSNGNNTVSSEANSENVINEIGNKTKNMIQVSDSKTSFKILSVSNLILALSFIAVFSIGVFIGVGFERRNKR